MKAKTMATFMLAGTLACAPLVGCSTQQPATDTTKEEQTQQTEQAPQEDVETKDGKEQLTGGWTVNTESFEALSEEERELFTKASEGYTGVSLEPVSVLATQVVSGTNYAFLCKETLVTAEPTTNWAIAVVYADLEGNASITSVENIDLTNVKVAEASQTTSDLVGGWTLAAPSNSVALPEDAHAAFGKAAESYVGVSLSPIALLGTQIVSGTNYLVLCQGTTATQDPQQGLYVAQLYADTNGNAQFTNVEQLDLLSYVG